METRCEVLLTCILEVSTGQAVDGCSVDRDYIQFIVLLIRAFAKCGTAARRMRSPVYLNKGPPIQTSKPSGKQIYGRMIATRAAKRLRPVCVSLVLVQSSSPTSPHFVLRSRVMTIVCYNNNPMHGFGS